MLPQYEVFESDHPRFTVVVVEDNADDEALTLRALRRSKLPLRIKVARDGQAALDALLDDEAEVPQLVLLDIKLPKLSGIEVLKRVRENERTLSVPIVVMSSSDENSDIKEVYRLHGSSYVQKPLEFVRYQDVVQRVAEYWIDINRFPCGQDRRNVEPLDLSTKD